MNGSTRKLGDGRTSVSVENSKEGRCVVSLDVGHRATGGLLWGRVVLVSLLYTGRKGQMQGVGILHACQGSNQDGDQLTAAANMHKVAGKVCCESLNPVELDISLRSVLGRSFRSS